MACSILGVFDAVGVFSRLAEVAGNGNIHMHLDLVVTNWTELAVGQILFVDENSSGWTCITLDVARTCIGMTNGAIDATGIVIVVLCGGIFAIWTGFTRGLRLKWV